MDEFLRLILHEYPEQLYEEHNSYPMAPEQKAVEKEWMSGYQKSFINDLDLTHLDNEKLLLTLLNKNNYITH